MNMFAWKSNVQAFDERRDIVIPGNEKETIEFSAKQFIALAQESIKEKNKFTVALSGGSTPKAIYKLLSTDTYANQVPWEKVFLFWSDERSVPPDHEESNYKMVLDAGFSHLPLLPEHIFRMKAENNIENHALDYERLLKNSLDKGSFDLVMLGIGEDGHTASLFPKTHGLHTTNRWVIANYIPQKDTWRMSLTFECINLAKHINIYVIGKAKATIIKKVLNGKYLPDEFPVERIGTPERKALWILDREAAKNL